jgi:hypothetical protein
MGDDPRPKCACKLQRGRRGPIEKHQDACPLRLWHEREVARGALEQIAEGAKGALDRLGGQANV